MGILLTISTVIGLIRKHIGTAEKFVALATEGVATFRRDDGTEIPPDRVSAEIDEALAQAALTSAGAAGRIDARHSDDPPEQP